MACEYKKLEIVKYFLTKISLEELMKSTCYKNGCAGITALHLAAAHDDEALIKYLLKEFATYRKATTKGGEESDGHVITDSADDLVDYERAILLEIKDGKVWSSRLLFNS